MAAAAYKVLGQVAPTATTETTLYTAPGGAQAIGATLAICNITTTVVKVTVRVRPAGAAAVNKHYLLKDVSVLPGTTPLVRGGITLAATDVVSVQLDTANGAAVQLFGTELS